MGVLNEISMAIKYISGYTILVTPSIFLDIEHPMDFYTLLKQEEHIQVLTDSYKISIRMFDNSWNVLIQLFSTISQLEYQLRYTYDLSTKVIHSVGIYRPPDSTLKNDSYVKTQCFNLCKMRKIVLRIAL